MKLIAVAGLFAFSLTALASVESNPGHVPARPLAITNDESQVPVTLPGFELRVLDASKRILIELDAERTVEANIPLYIYFPKSGISLEQMEAQAAEMENALQLLVQAEARLQDDDLKKAVLLMASAVRDYTAPIASKKVATAPAPTKKISPEQNDRVVYEKVLSETVTPPAPQAAAPATPAPQSAAPTAEQLAAANEKPKAVLMRVDGSVITGPTNTPTKAR